MEPTASNENAIGTDTALADFLIYSRPGQISTLPGPHAADFTIHSGTQSWRVHRETLCKRSVYFSSICDGPFKEATQNHSTLHDDDPNAVHDMVTYLIYDSYGPAFTYSALETHIANYDIADKYLLSSLKAGTVRQFSTSAYHAWPTGTVYDPASDFAAAVDVVYEDASELREDPLKRALRSIAILRLLQALPKCWQQARCEHDPPKEWMVQWGTVPGGVAEPDVPRFMVDFWKEGSKIYGWWFKSGFPGMRFKRGRGGEGGKVSCWVYES